MGAGSLESGESGAKTGEGVWGVRGEEVCLGWYRGSRGVEDSDIWSRKYSNCRDREI